MDSHYLTERLLRLINLFNEAEETPGTYGTDSKLTRAEIHTVEVLGSRPNLNVTRLAQIMGTSKSASSQMLDRLKAKKLVTQVKVQGSRRDTALSLTELGQIAYGEHRASHERFHAELGKIIATLGPDGEGKLVTDFDQIESFLKKTN